MYSHPGRNDRTPITARSTTPSPPSRRSPTHSATRTTSAIVAPTTSDGPGSFERLSEVAYRAERAVLARGRRLDRGGEQRPQRVGDVRIGAQGSLELALDGSERPTTGVVVDRVAQRPGASPELTTALNQRSELACGQSVDDLVVELQHGAPGAVRSGAVCDEPGGERCEVVGELTARRIHERDREADRAAERGRSTARESVIWPRTTRPVPCAGARRLGVPVCRAGGVPGARRGSPPRQGVVPHPRG